MPRLQDLPLISWVIRLIDERVTSRGLYVLAATFLFTILAVNLRASQIFLLFSAGAALLAVAVTFTLGRAPRVRIDCRLPERATAGTPLPVNFTVHSDRVFSDLRVSFPSIGPHVAFQPSRQFLSCGPEEPALGRAEFRATRRGKYELPGVRICGSDPLRLLTTQSRALPPQALLVYPRYYTMEEFIVPLGRRYQPGGIPLSSHTGDSIEFIGTRDFRMGDPIRNIHWRSWARRGKPVVKEFQEEYFCRIAIILDTFLPPGAPDTGAASRAFEAAISVVASITDYFSRSEYIVDILAAGPDIYEVSAGRSLAYLENVLDVLACLEPCHEPPFAAIGPHLFDKLEQITTVVAVLQDWDEARFNFLRQVKALGAAVRAIVVHDGPTAHPWEPATDALGEISQMTAAEVETLLQAAPVKT